MASVASSLTLPLSLRVPLIVAGLMVLMGLIASQLVMSSLVRSQERQLSDLARSDFVTLSTTIAPLIQRQDIWEMYDVLDRATQRTGGFSAISASLVDARGRVIVSTRPEQYPVGAHGVDLIASSVPVTELSYDNAQDVISLRDVIVYQGRPIAQFIIEFDASALAAERRQTWFWLIAGNAAATGLLALGGYFMIRRVLAPIGRLSRAMSVPGGPPQAFAPEMIPHRDRELANLYETYNSMTRAVEARSLTERRLAERERFVSLGRLSGTLAHEINNPLGGLLNSVDTIKRFPERSDVVLKSADILERGLKQMRDVARSTLSTYRNDLATLPLTTADFEDLYLLIRPEIERKAQELHWNIDVDDADCAALPAGPVRQVLLNLLLNASGASDAGTELGLRIGVEAQTLHLTVWDSGPGLPPHVRPRLLSDAPVDPGGGLGLRLVRDLVTSLKGDIRLSRTENGYSAIIVTLPLSPAEEKSDDA
ncbi:MAG: HAMP domain-containing sensor histidine kinase [Roseovarius sp.]|nr:HAMP domain-containing sensor histidine kinase [Roseovarius sp.]